MQVSCANRLVYKILLQASLAYVRELLTITQTSCLNSAVS